jgi:thiol-disulfide isomerase/thioredoxin
MKKLGLLLVAFLTLLSCEPEHPKEYISISGTLENSQDSILYITGLGIRKKIEIQENGSFQDSLKVITPKMYTFSAPRSGRAYIYLANGYNIQLKGDANQFFTSFEYEGNNEAAQSNNFLVDRLKFAQTSESPENTMALQKDEFTAELEHQRNQLEAIVNKYPKANQDLVKEITEQHEQFLAKLESNYDQTHEFYKQQKIAKEKLAKGKPAPEFTDYEDFSGGTKSLSDFRGNFVYIDVWATWCRPCLAQIPYLKQLEKDFEGKNISFVSISTDDARRSQGSWDKAREKWQNMVKAKELSGVQLWAGEDDIRFSKEYVITGIPRFILIDPEGNIVNSNEMRPSSPNINEYLTSVGVK